MRSIELSGAPRTMGEGFGESFRGEIATLYSLRLENALRQAREYGGVQATEAELLALAGSCLVPTKTYDSRGHDELCGIADGAGLAVEQVMALGGLTDLRDGLAWSGHSEQNGGCSACLAPREATANDELLCAQTWDLGSENLPFVVAVTRRPDEGPKTYCITTVGCLSLIGMNEDGLCVGTTNLRTRDARAGVPYLSLIHRALASTTLPEAASSIAAAPRAGGHFFWLGDAEGRGLALECSATKVAQAQPGPGSLVHANHALSAEVQPFEVQQNQRSSHARQARLEALLHGWHGEIDESALQSFLGDEAGGVDAICRHDFEGITSNAAVVASPEKGEMRICHGPPCEADWQNFGPAFD